MRPVKPLQKFARVRSTKEKLERLFQVFAHQALVLVADFFMKCHEVAWVIVSGICQSTLVVVICNDGLRNDAGNSAIKAFGRFGSAG